MSLYLSIVKNAIVAGGLIAILNGCDSGSVSDCYQGSGECQPVTEKNVCHTQELSDCLVENHIESCGSDYQCISLCEKKCSEYILPGCELTPYGIEWRSNQNFSKSLIIMNQVF